MNPTVTSFVFTPFYSVGDIHGGFGSLIICFVPRILVGVVPYYVYRLFDKIGKDYPKKQTLHWNGGVDRFSYEHAARYEFNLCTIWRKLCCGAECIGQIIIWCDFVGNSCKWYSGSNCGSLLL